MSPRAGFTWDPIGDGRTLVRGGYGRFYDKMFLLVARNALLARQSISLSGADATASSRQGAFPESDQLPPGFTLSRPSINLSDPEMEIPYMDQVSLGVERQIVDGLGRRRELRPQLGIGAAGVGQHQPRSAHRAHRRQRGVTRREPTPTPSSSGGRTTASTNRLDPLYNNIQMVSSSGWS